MTVHFAEACGVFLHTGVFYLKLRADFAGFWEEPDVFSSYSDTAYTVQKEDKLADLSKYFTEEELSQYVDSYIQDGYFNQDGALYLFPVAKSAEITMINKTDWEPFAEATGTTVDELTTTEGITEVAGEGALYDCISRESSSFVLEDPVQGDLQLVRGALVGKQKIYAITSNLDLYSRNVPYPENS